MNVTKSNIPGVSGMTEINNQLQQLRNGLMREIQAKQQTITQYEQEISRLLELLQVREREIQQQAQQRDDAEMKTEGNKQLINKLLSQIDRLQQDIDWYKQTYVKRSLLGTIKQKLFSR